MSSTFIPNLLFSVEILIVHPVSGNSAPVSLSPVDPPLACMRPQLSQTERSQSPAVLKPLFQNRLGARWQSPLSVAASVHNCQLQAAARNCDRNRPD